MTKPGPKDVNELAFGMMQRFIEKDKKKGADSAEQVSVQAVSGAMGGAARAQALSPEERSKAAQKAARARWEKSET